MKKKRAKRFKLGFLIIIILIILIILLRNFKVITIFLIIAVIAGILNYFIHLLNIHIHIGHVSFFAIVFSYVHGIKYGVAMIIIAHVIPEILAGHVDLEMITDTITYGILSLTASIFHRVDIVILGLMLTAIQGFGSYFLGKLTAEPIGEILTEHGVEFIMSIIYYVSFANFLVRIIG